MTDRHIKQIENQLPTNESISRMYRALEGDTRVITKDTKGNEYRYTCVYDAEKDTVSIKRF